MLAPLRSAAQRLGAYQIRQGRAYTRGIGTRNVDATMASASSSITDNLRFVTDQAAQAAARVGGKPPRVVAVSKTKPVEDLMEAYNAGHRDFGENYVQELVGKASALPADIRWRFIGHLQSNKVKALLEGVPSLSCIETVDSVKLADKLNAAVAAIGRPPLDVMIQVNTSGEESKHGLEPGEVVDVCRHVATQCGSLRLVGLMTIGMPDYTSRPENFQTLGACRAAVAEALGVDCGALELSMGMSGDYVQAIEMSSNNVRVGSTIFGARNYSK